MNKPFLTVCLVLAALTPLASNAAPPPDRHWRQTGQLDLNAASWQDSSSVAAATETMTIRCATMNVVQLPD